MATYYANDPNPFAGEFGSSAPSFYQNGSNGGGAGTNGDFSGGNLNSYFPQFGGSGGNSGGGDFQSGINDVLSRANNPTASQGFTSFSGQPVSNYQTPSYMQQPQGGGGGVPGFQSMLDDRNYMGQMSQNAWGGAMAPAGAPDYARNPQTEQDWQNRYNWFGQYPETLQQGYNGRFTAPTIPYQQFANNVYGEQSAQRQWNELAGTLDQNRLNDAINKYGWKAQPGAGNFGNYNQAYQAALGAAQNDPNSDYSIVTLPTGYGVLSRERSQQAQEQRGFYAPGSRPAPPPPTYNRGYSGGYSSGSRYSAPVRQAAAPPPAPTYVPPLVAGGHQLPQGSGVSLPGAGNAYYISPGNYYPTTPRPAGWQQSATDMQYTPNPVNFGPVAK